MDSFIKSVHPIIATDIELIVSKYNEWEKLKGTTVLITGANGFLPSYMLYTLLYLNDSKKIEINILALVRNSKKAKAKFGNLLERNDLKIIEQDVCLPIIFDEKIDYIIHAASQASPKYYGVDPVGTLSANVIGTKGLLDLALQKQVKSFLFFSTSEVYGIVDSSKIPTKENDYGYIDPTNVRACYAESKRMGENMCVSYLHQYKVPVKIVRPFHTYGPGMELNDGRVYADFIANIVQNENIEMKSDGLAMRAFCYSADATLGFFKVLLAGENGEAYNVGNPNGEISIINLAEKLVNLFPEKKLSVIKQQQTNANYIPSAVQRNCPDASKIGALGWQATTNIEEGFYRTITSYQ
ncbi:MAG: NAD-dependent epimerase/dehydratase family protein [Bacteroidia bacterium]